MLNYHHGMSLLYQVIKYGLYQADVFRMKAHGWFIQYVDGVLLIP